MNADTLMSFGHVDKFCLRKHLCILLKCELHLKALVIVMLRYLIFFFVIKDRFLCSIRHIDFLDPFSCNLHYIAFDLLKSHVPAACQTLNGLYFFRKFRSVFTSLISR